MKSNIEEDYEVIKRLLKQVKIKLNMCKKVIQINQFDIFDDVAIKNIRFSYFLVDEGRFKFPNEKLKSDVAMISNFLATSLESIIRDVIVRMYNIADYGTKRWKSDLESFYDLRLFLCHSQSQKVERSTILKSEIRAIGKTEIDYKLEWNITYIVEKSGREYNGIETLAERNDVSDKKAVKVAEHIDSLFQKFTPNKKMKSLVACTLDDSGFLTNQNILILDVMKIINYAEEVLCNLEKKLNMEYEGVIENKKIRKVERQERKFLRAIGYSDEGIKEKNLEQE